MTYRTLVVLLVLLPAVALLMAWLWESTAALFVVESATLFAFATFWLVKTYELSRSHTRIRIV